MLLEQATNTMHKVAPAIKSAITIPFLDIFSATAAAVVNAGCSRPLLMATAYTMEQVRVVKRIPVCLLVGFDSHKLMLRTFASTGCERLGSLQWYQTQKIGR